MGGPVPLPVAAAGHAEARVRPVHDRPLADLPPEQRGVRQRGSARSQGVRGPARAQGTERRRRIEHPEDLDPCEKCEPADWFADPDAEFEVEVTWYKYALCRDADELLLAGRKEATCKNCWCKPHRGKCATCSCEEYIEAPRSLSIPMQRLLAKIRTDPDIAAAIRKNKTRV